MEIRHLTVIKDVVFTEGGSYAARPVTRVAACAVIANPLRGIPAGRCRATDHILRRTRRETGHEALPLLSGPATSYGKAAIVGTAGDIEQRCGAASSPDGQADAAPPSGAVPPLFRRTSRLVLLVRFSMFRSDTKTTSGPLIISIH